MPHTRFFYRGVEDGSDAVSQGIAQGLLGAFPLPDEAQAPDRLQELVAILLERDALGPASEPSYTKIALAEAHDEVDHQN